METYRFFHVTTKATTYLLFLTFNIASAASAQALLREQPPEPDAAMAGANSAAASTACSYLTLSFFMHDRLGGSNPSARAVTGIVTKRAVPFAKPNGAFLPMNNGVPLNNNNIPFLTGLGGSTSTVIQNSGGFTLQKLMFGTMTVIDDELTEGHELGSGLTGKAQGFYVASSEDGKSQMMAFTAMFESGGYADSLSFFGVHRTAVTESQLAIMGGTGKYVNAKGYATIITIRSTDQIMTDGIDTLLEFTVYVHH